MELLASEAASWYCNHVIRIVDERDPHLRCVRAMDRGGAGPKAGAEYVPFCSGRVRPRTKVGKVKVGQDYFSFFSFAE